MAAMCDDEINQLEQGKVTERVLLSPTQVEQLIAFVKAGK